MNAARYLYRKFLNQNARNRIFLMMRSLNWHFSSRWKSHDKANIRLIVSLTSYPPRYEGLVFTLRSLLGQSVRPDKVVLWAQGPLPAKVIALQTHGLTIKQGDPALGSYNKLVGSLRLWPDSCIVVADDDIIYPLNWLRDFVKGFDETKREVLFQRGHRIMYGPEDSYLDYEQWEWETDEEGPSFDLFPTGAGGVFYPPGALHELVGERELFLNLCPTTDDVWFYWMARANGTMFRRVGGKLILVGRPGSQHVALAMENSKSDGTSMQFRRTAEFCQTFLSRLEPYTTPPPPQMAQFLTSNEGRPHAKR
jgi:hypothetical protein